MNQTVPNSQAAARAAGFAFRPKDSAAFERDATPTGGWSRTSWSRTNRR